MNTIWFSLILIMKNRLAAVPNPTTTYDNNLNYSTWSSMVLNKANPTMSTKKLAK